MMDKQRISEIKAEASMYGHDVTLSGGEMLELLAALEAAEVERDKYAGEWRRLEAELEKWQRPYDPELFDEIEKQAAHSNSLAAQGLYITALEKRVKELEAAEAAEAERDELKRRVAELEAALTEIDGLQEYVISEGYSWLNIYHLAKNIVKKALQGGAK